MLALNMTDGTRTRVASAALAIVMVASVAKAAAQYQGWDIPLAALEDRSPLASSPNAAALGKTIFAAHCTRCHGQDGTGHGPDSNHAADLTDDLRDTINPDGVLFYKVWNGHAIQLRTQVDDMPPFKDKLSRDEVWYLVEYLKVLRMPRR